MIPDGGSFGIVQGGNVGSDGYLEAFMNGFEFVLLAIRGRLAETDLPDEERQRLEAFLEDYWRIAKAYRDRRPAPEPSGLSVSGPFAADLKAVAPN